jgi:hypothetical protein
MKVRRKLPSLGAAFRTKSVARDPLTTRAFRKNHGSVTGPALPHQPHRAVRQAETGQPSGRRQTPSGVLSRSTTPGSPAASAPSATSTKTIQPSRGNAFVLSPGSWPRLKAKGTRPGLLSSPS